MHLMFSLNLHVIVGEIEKARYYCLPLIHHFEHDDKTLRNVIRADKLLITLERTTFKHPKCSLICCASTRVDFKL